jgi:hypothetical protein
MIEKIHLNLAIPLVQSALVHHLAAFLREPQVLEIKREDPLRHKEESRDNNTNHFFPRFKY